MNNSSLQDPNSLETPAKLRRQGQCHETWWLSSVKRRGWSSGCLLLTIQLDNRQSHQLNFRGIIRMI